MRRLICCLLLCLAAPWVLAALDLNTATEADLDALPGVGPSRAQAIIEHRAKNGPFASVDDLRNVKGIGDKTFAELKPLLTVSAVAGASTSGTTASAPSASPTSDGFPWWVVALIGVVAVIGIVVMRRRASLPEIQTPAAAPPARSAASPPPRPAGGTAGTPPAPPARPAGVPPRPAGSPPAQPSADSAAAGSAAPPKPAGAPPKPAGSR
ncbi:helix-hairpin-helix domain-containing protein [Methyloversatilis sp.]|uniref:ComEA family DNA-binding protein n=1 Tax=Methyloversatilis sp. TaxID=2569862 RepID=UPI00273436B9|nr:helix-hairpin-helix domain-containing protein [Methyloversatilis sp.]MDP2868536.1 helix-hairpin-helix domain-containing protein [Methyloversatilis sp.]MDP3455918.1 helix-hairpin-helix domain-containing protein [Methyloversatilis sp.]MDP3577681.1 helix-hairpin-helix domain-containing protein [Methyloversatilis sp.]